MKKNFLSFFILSFAFVNCVFCQEPFIRLGQKALMGGDFNTAASYFEKAYTENNSDMNALWFMGYSYYHASEYRKCVYAFDKLITLKPSETVAYYYRGKAKTVLYTGLTNMMAVEKEKLIKAAIKDFSTGIDLSPNDLKFYQNRGLAYYDLGLFKNQKLPNVYNKAEAIANVTLALKDYQKLMVYNNGRADIVILIDKAKHFLVDVQ
jgi:tetratricopeptide (TPR) repeat protein